MWPGIVRNVSCALGDCLTSRPEGHSRPRESWFPLHMTVSTASYMYMYMYMYMYIHCEPVAMDVHVHVHVYYMCMYTCTCTMYMYVLFTGTMYIVLSATPPQSVNRAMQKDREGLTIGVLDIYGFEIFMV